MKTNINQESEHELAQAGRKFLEAAYEFWKLHQKHLGREAVVWIEDANGHFAVFTRGEYKEVLLDNIEAGLTETKAVLHEKVEVPAD